jgi:hypothetical protein
MGVRVASMKKTNEVFGNYEWKGSRDDVVCDVEVIARIEG